MTIKKYLLMSIHHDFHASGFFSDAYSRYANDPYYTPLSEFRETQNWSEFILERVLIFVAVAELFLSLMLFSVLFLRQNIDLDEEREDTEPDQQSTSVSLGDRMKFYEKYTLGIISVPASSPFIIRLDGNKFSTFTRGLKKPFDTFFTNVMIATLHDVMSKFNPSTGYTHSDEITLVFPPCREFGQHPFGGRKDKLISLVASYTSLKFNEHINQMVVAENYSDKMMDRIRSNTAIFDARMLVFPNGMEHEIINHMIWRSKIDCYRNCVSTVARGFYSNRQLFKKTVKEMVKMMKNDHNYDIHTEIPNFWKYGTYVKKVMVPTQVINPITGELIDVLKGKYQNRTMIIEKYSPDYLDLLFHKCWMY